ncbi:MAG: hypothetical protein Q9227_004166 [Pyrenula ochraceoflavens]
MENAPSAMLRCIGKGNCGSVWAVPTESQDGHAIKREDGCDGRSLFNDFIMHRKILEQQGASTCLVRIPRCLQYVPTENTTWWSEEIKRFPDTYEACNALITERIPPLPQTVRERIIDLYCPEALRKVIKGSNSDEDCLIRPYLGRRRRLEKQSRFHAFSLRNYPLHADQIEELGLDGPYYAEAMAEMLASMYWNAHIDANDVEFVLAPAKEGPSPMKILHSEVLGEHVVWLLDFDCCRDMSMNEQGVEQAVRSFFRNDPFYPRPCRSNPYDQLLWNVFKTRFLRASDTFLGSKSGEAKLPALWIDMVERRGSS